MSKTICRVCLKQGATVNIFAKRRSRLISEHLMSLSKVRIHHEDGLPDTVCKKCLNKLNDCLNFIKLCIDSDSKLRILQKKQILLDIKNDTELSTNNVTDTDENNRERCNSNTSEDMKVGDNYTEDETKNILFQTGSWEEIKTDELEQRDLKLSKKAVKQQCFTCGKIMSSRFRLKTHQKIHSDERPFACPHCSKTFALAQYLKAHIRIHTGEKPFKCSECNATFTHTSGLYVHMRKHTGQLPYPCALCPQRFRWVGHLQYHLRQHTGEKNFECDTCGKAFITRNQLKQHFLTHSGEKPHVCSVCGIRITRAGHLRRHMLRMHNPQKFKETTPEKPRQKPRCASKSPSKKLQQAEAVTEGVDSLEEIECS